MISANIKDHFRSIIKNKRDAVINWIRNSSYDNLKLRLFEEEKIPSQRDLTILEDFDKSLERIESGDFGECSICKKEINRNELELDFTKQVCIDCYNEEEKKLLERDLEMAAKVQNYLLPNELPVLDGFQISVFSESAGIVGGDYFDFFCGIDNNQGIVIGDVMGKGLSASLLMSNIQASLRILGPDNHKMNILAERLNKMFRFNSKLISFISLFIAKLNTNSGLLEYCNAGHNPPLFFESNTNKISLLKPTGPAIGLTSNPTFNLSSIYLKPGDLIIMYTDGLTESRNDLNEQFTHERIKSILLDQNSNNANEILNVIKDEVIKFAKGRLHDDITVMVLKKE